MKNYCVRILIEPLAELPDPAGQAVRLGLIQLGISQVTDVRIGKQILLHLAAATAAEAQARATYAAEKLLANRITESFYIAEVKEL
jgi:phosphoribosylformylglycinamidine synthase